jgi:hypothetical protein
MNSVIPEFAKAEIFAVFCDDIRHEVGNKASLIGIYNGDLLASDLPIFMPRLGVMFQLRTPLDYELSNVTYRITSGDEVIMQVDIMVEAGPSRSRIAESRPDGQDPTSFRSVVSFLAIPPMTFTSPCTLRAIAIANGVEYVAGKLHVSRAPAERSVDVVPASE